MNETDPPRGETQCGRVTAKEREENARKARETADLLYPRHQWKKVEDGIFLSHRRAIGKKSNYKDELRNAQILRDFGSTVYMAPEGSREKGKKHDAIVDGQVFEFKNIGGNASTLATMFLRSRQQAPNVFLNLENSPLSKREALSALYGARNKPETPDRRGYAHHNRFQGGRIVLKIREQSDLIHIDVDDFEVPV